MRRTLLLGIHVRGERERAQEVDPLVRRSPRQVAALLVGIISPGAAPTSKAVTRVASGMAKARAIGLSWAVTTRPTNEMSTSIA